MCRGGFRGGAGRRCGASPRHLAFRGKRGCLSVEAPQSPRVARRGSVHGLKSRADAGSCPDFHAGEINLLRLLCSLGFAPRLKVKLHRLAKVPLGCNESPALSCHGHIQATRNEPFAIILKNRMNHSHTIHCAIKRRCLQAGFSRRRRTEVRQAILQSPQTSVPLSTLNHFNG